MNKSRSLLYSAVLSGLVFSGAVLFLAANGSNPITVEVEERPLFSGQFQDLSVPYLGLATGLSLGTGLAAFSTLAWRDTKRRLEQSVQQATYLKQQLNRQEEIVESLKFSEAKLQSNGLRFFLDELPENALPQARQASTVHRSAAIDSAYSPETVSASSVHAITSLPLQRSEARLAVQPQVQNETPQIEELKSTLKQIMSQIEQLQSTQLAHNGNSVNASVHA